MGASGSQVLEVSCVWSFNYTSISVLVESGPINPIWGSVYGGNWSIDDKELPSSYLVLAPSSAFSLSWLTREEQRGAWLVLSLPGFPTFHIKDSVSCYNPKYLPKHEPLCLTRKIIPKLRLIFIKIRGLNDFQCLPCSQTSESSGPERYKGNREKD